MRLIQDWRAKVPLWLWPISDWNADRNDGE